MATTDPSPSREILTGKLSGLLGFDDGDDGGAADVLDYLLSMETGEELLEYLGQLLGRSSNDAEVLAFVHDVGTVQRGGSLQPPQPAVVSATAAVAPKPPPVKAAAAAPPPPPPPAPQAKSSTKKQKAETRTTTIAAEPSPREEGNKNTPESNAAAGKQPSTTKPSSNQPPLLIAEEGKAAAESLPPSTAKPSPPAPPVPVEVGRVVVECGCFGTLHRPLANCLSCGRCSCEKEGFGWCPFCGSLVREVQPPDEKEGPMADAWALKESMLQKDRASRRQTAQVIDDQADYFASTTGDNDKQEGTASSTATANATTTAINSAWLTDDEQTAAIIREEQRQDELHRRQNMQFKLSPL